MNIGLFNIEGWDETVRIKKTKNRKKTGLRKDKAKAKR